MGELSATPFAVLTAIFASVLLSSSGFYWAVIGLFSGVAPYVDDQYTSIDAIHAGLLFTFGLLGLLSALKIAWPASTIVSLLCFFIIGGGMAAEVAIIFILYPCSQFQTMIQTQSRYFSTSQLLLCSSSLPAPISNLGPWYGYCMLLIPLASAWLGFFSMLLTFVAWVKVDKFYFV